MEHEIVRSVAAAQKDAQAADALVRQYLPFIKAETAKFLKRIPVEGQDDELGIAMFAFHEAAMAYQSGRGSFLKLAAAAIRNRLIDYQRMEQRHAGHISLDQTVDGDAEGRTLLETIDTGHDEIAHRQELGAAQEEIMQFTRELAQYGLRLTDIAENCPKQERRKARSSLPRREGEFIFEKIADALDRLFLVRPLHLQHGLASDRESERNQRQDAVELRLLAVAGFDGEGVVRKFLIDGVQNHTRRTAMDAGLVHYRENTFFHRRPF